jgi:hypothetical protein
MHYIPDAKSARILGEISFFGILFLLFFAVKEDEREEQSANSERFLRASPCLLLRLNSIYSKQ